MPPTVISKISGPGGAPAAPQTPPTSTQLAAAGAVMQDGSTAITAPQQGVPGVGPNDFATVSQVDAAAIAAAKTYTDAQVAAALAPANTQVNASRAFAPADNLATLEIVGNVTLTNPTGLPAGWRCNALIVGAFTCIVGTGAGDTTVKNFSGALQFGGDGAMGTFMLDSGGRIVWNADGI